MINSVLNEGIKGMQGSQREMLKSAQDIASQNIRTEGGSNPENGEDQVVPPVNAAEESGRVGNIAEPLIELRRQELLFTASAKVVSTADDVIGSLLDVKS